MRKKNVPLPLFLAVLAWAVVVSLFHYVGDPLPFVDRGNRIFATQDKKAMYAVVSLFEMLGIKPTYRHDSAEVKRAILADGTIINTNSPSFHKKIGNAAAGPSIVTSAPMEKAHAAKRHLETFGFKAEVIEHEDSPNPGDVVFLTSDAFMNGQWVIVFRKHKLQLGSPPPKWKWEEVSQ